MTTIQDGAYKLAASFYLSSCHNDWSGERIRRAVLAEEDGPPEALADQRKLVLWEPIEEHLFDDRYPKAGPREELDALIGYLADAFVEFASNPS
jgi:hypothetical protein